MSVYKLIAEANKSTQLRNHDMKWRLIDNDRAEGECIKCGLYVYANVHPAPNEIDIGGPAVAINCNGSK